MGEDVVLAADVLLGQKVLSLVVEDNVHLLSAWAADVGTKHDVVGRVAMHGLLVKSTGEYLDIATTAVDVLFMLYGELDD